MNILSIETSCDETALSVVKVEGEFPQATYEVIGDAINSQVAIHAEYGGVFPMMAKREHAKAITPLLKLALEEAELLEEGAHELNQKQTEELYEILNREPGLSETLEAFLEQYDKPEIDVIAVTSGPGLEPALWVGVNFARSLAKIWNIPVVATNHMEGHILASIYDVEDENALSDLQFPTIALLVSGGHTELVLMNNWGQYKKIGQTRDDAVGEAFDKAARMMGLPYPGGPEISRLAKLARAADLPAFADLPRPMLHSGDLDFSFSGIKTAVRYAIGEKELSETDKQALARDFEDAVTEVIVKKTMTAVEEYGAQSIVVGGGVSANRHLNQELNKAVVEQQPHITTYFPKPGLSTDNSVMIALAGHARLASAVNAAAAKYIRADGNRSISEE